MIEMESLRKIEKDHTRCRKTPRKGPTSWNVLQENKYHKLGMFPNLSGITVKRIVYLPVPFFFV